MHRRRRCVFAVAMARLGHTQSCSACKESRLADQTQSIKLLTSMLERHVEHMFPEKVMDAYKASLTKERAENEGGNENAGHELDEAEGPVEAEVTDSAPSGRRVRAAARPRAGQGAPKRSKSEGALSKKHVLMPESGVKTSLDKDSEGFFTRACNYYRQAVPDDYANHAFFASAMKVDQTFARFVATRMRKREAFLKILFGNSWVMIDESHPVDLPMAEVSLRCDLAMRFAVYNELQQKLAKASAGPGSVAKTNGEDGEGAADIPSGNVRVPGKATEFEKATRKILRTAQQNEEGRVEFNGDMLKHHPTYKGAKGWCQFVAHAHAQKLITKIAGEGGRMLPAVEAILDGQVELAESTTARRSKGPAFILSCVATSAWLTDEGATQPGQPAAPAGEPSSAATSS